MKSPLFFSLIIDYKNSKLFKNVPHEVVKTLEEKNSTANYHGYCTTEEVLKILLINKEPEN